MRIEKITKQKNGMYQIKFDKKTISIHEDLILKYNVLYKKELDNNILSKLSIENGIFELYNKTLNFISYRLRSSKEIAAFINKKEVSTSTKNMVIERLTKQGYLDDDRFKEAYIRDKMKLTNYGPYKIMRDLNEHDIESSIDDFNEIEVNNKINKLITKDLKTNKKYTNNILKQRIYNHLKNLGFGEGMIIEVLKSYSFNNSNIEKDFIKITKKYHDEYTIKQKLKALGYTSEEINEYIEKDTAY